MYQESRNKTRAATGLGNIHRITRTVKGKTYTYYQVRYTEGYDPGTGKQIQRSITGKTPTEVAGKMRKVICAMESGTYVPPNKLTLGQWLDIWTEEYLGNVKESTAAAYKASIRTHIKPRMGAVRLDALTTHMIQTFYNGLLESTEDRKAVSPKTVKNIHGILHKALRQAIANGYLRLNPTEYCILPRIEKRDIQPLDEDEIRSFLKAIKGKRFEMLYIVTLFTGLREGEVLGLTWDRINFGRGTILVSKQLQKEKKAGGEFRLVSLKNDRPRRIMPAPMVMQILKDRQLLQEAQKKQAGDRWFNPMNLVFTNEYGSNLIPQTVFRQFKEIVNSIGRPDARFHDLRHSYAVAAIMAGDDIKTVQGNLGHASAAFTLDVYGHVTDQMKQASARRMQSYIESILSINSD